MSRNGPLALAFHTVFVIFMLAPIVVVCLVAFTPEGYLSMPTSGFSLRWFRAIADYPEFVRGFWTSVWLGALSSTLAVVISTPAALAIARAVDRVADELGVSSAQVATAWVRAQGYGFIPIVGARKVEQIADTLGAVAVSLSAAQLAALDEVSRVSLGFPHDFLASSGVLDLVRSEVRGRIDGRPR